ncbi:MAG: energy transducer TonB [Rhizomicrobium sp.]
MIARKSFRAAALALVAGQALAQTAAMPPSPAPATKPAPDMHNCRTRVYPARAVRLRQEGRVVLRVVVAVDGSVKDASVLQSSGVDELDKATLACVSQFHYRPAMQNGAAIESQTTLAINWCLSQTCTERYSRMPPPDVPAEWEQPAL